MNPLQDSPGLVAMHEFLQFYPQCNLHAKTFDEQSTFHKTRSTQGFAGRNSPHFREIEDSI
jgi:hypothetical protein